MHTEWTLFVNSGNCKTSELHRLLLNLADQINLKRSDKYVALLNSTIYCTWNKKLKISAPTWNGKIDLPDGSYSVSDIQDYFDVS